MKKVVCTILALAAGAILCWPLIAVGVHIFLVCFPVIAMHLLIILSYNIRQIIKGEKTDWDIHFP